MDSPAATAKRKRTDAGADLAVQASVEEVSDAEVEEFYAILRRMRDASHRFVSGGARTGAGARGCPPGPVRAPAWRPSFALEDFAPPAAPATTAASHQHQNQQQQLQRPPSDERVAENATPPPPRPAVVSLDLNVEPEPEAPATLRPQRVHA